MFCELKINLLMSNKYFSCLLPYMFPADTIATDSVAINPTVLITIKRLSLDNSYDLLAYR